ncbi:MAG: NAD(P)-dependent glycerol-3-phosphate dehydrogenase [Planctomycetes bacterium]|nr:NAD(P)-dependent glycerol-3-phosphate dehydrogenase [Planctomycetota bacterium]MCB9870012.1 NAD(P)-dependent glycerol-3-phosphate dehydrogenase [Planctomycetota bacterium]
MKIAVLGNGGFGTAMAMVASRAGHSVAQWGHDAEYTAQMARERANPRYLPDIEIPRQIEIGADPGPVLQDAGAVLVAVPTQHVRGVMTALRDAVPSGVPVVSLAKGLEQATRLRPSQVLNEALGAAQPVLVLSGPSHAEEVARGLPTTVVLAGRDAELVQTIQSELTCDSFRVYRNGDRLGVELCGALKNVMAVAAGMAQGFGLGDNARAAILSRGIVEMARFGLAEGAELHTFFGLAGMGDLAVTAFSQHGRNRALGERIGRGETLDEVLASTRKVAEGVWTSRVVRERAAELGVDMPLCCAVAAVLFDRVPIAQAVQSLMGRDTRDEVLS